MKVLRTDKSTVVILALAVAISCVAGAIVFYDESSTYTISYELDGGELEEGAQTSYQTGFAIKLPYAVKEGYIFLGWVFSEDDEFFYNGDTTTLSGDIVLKALYKKNLAGYWVTYSVYRDYQSSPIESYTMTGTHSFQYMYYNEEEDSYFIHSTYNYIRINSDGSQHPYSGEYEYWTSDLDRSDPVESTETIYTVDGYKECTVSEYTNRDGSKDTYWSTDDAWFSYKWVTTEYSGFFFKKTIITTYSYVESGQKELPKDCTIEVVTGSGISVTGNASPYSQGQIAKLTANTDSGVTFAGWYDSNFQLLSSNTTYSFMVSGSIKIYAMNKDSIDYTYASDESVNLDIEGLFSDTATYTITNVDTYESDTVTEKYYTFEDGGRYSVVVSDQDNNLEKIYTVKVTGYADREFSWKYNDKTLTITIEIDYDDLLKTRDYYSVDERRTGTESHNRSFVTLACENSFMKPYMDQIVQKIYAEMQSNGISITDSNVANVILKFTQYIEYQLDEDYMGADEYFKFPIETLYDQGGDCEDTSILFAAIAYSFKQTYNMSYTVGYELIPQHAIAIVKLPGVTKDTNPYGWLYCETTSKTVNAKDVGVIPSNMSVYSNYYGYKSVSDYFLTSKYYNDRYSTCQIIEIG